MMSRICCRIMRGRWYQQMETGSALSRWLPRKEILRGVHCTFACWLSRIKHHKNMRIRVFLKVGGSSLPSRTIYRVIILLLLLLLLLKKKKRKRIRLLLHATHSLKGANCALSPRELGFLCKRGRIKAFTQTNSWPVWRMQVVSGPGKREARRVRPMTPVRF